MILLLYPIGGSLVGLLISLVGSSRGRVVAAVVYDVVHGTAAIAVAAGRRVAVVFARHRGHHTQRWLKTYKDAGDTQAFPQVRAS